MTKRPNIELTLVRMNGLEITLILRILISLLKAHNNIFGRNNLTKPIPLMVYNRFKF